MLTRTLVVVITASAAGMPACADFILPNVDLRATTEIHGVPPMGAAHVENKVYYGAPLDGTVVTLFDDLIEVDKPPQANVVTSVVTVTPLGARGQHIEVSFFGPNAMDGGPGDDLPIFADLYGTYTDSDNSVGSITGPVDFFTVAALLRWDGLDASDLLDESSIHVVIVDVDGTVVQLNLGDHPVSISYFHTPIGSERLRIGLMSSSLEFGAPWVPRLIDTADEIHLSFDVFIPAPATLVLLSMSLLPTRRRRAIV
ncbi:MAG: hypothetical protein E2O40_06910 [Planctomycetota bacterium]|nr:MAG: hypothetical protein E2O40_06910 [Planctomycetota bacterium]